LFELNRYTRRLRHALTRRRRPNKLDSNQGYPYLVETLKRNHDYEEAMSLAVGGRYYDIGAIERQILIQAGLLAGHTLIDVGCGSGRTAYALRTYLDGSYIGYDIVPELVEYAKEKCQRPDWKFGTVDRIQIPEPDGSADMVCFFSVFTHLLHEQSFNYLREAVRVLKPGGAIIFSFLEYGIPGHWSIFEQALAGQEDKAPLNVFLAREIVQIWAGHLDCEIDTLESGDTQHVEFDAPLVLEDGTVLEGKQRFGQSLCVLRQKRTQPQPG